MRIIVASYKFPIYSSQPGLSEQDREFFIRNYLVTGDDSATYAKENSTKPLEVRGSVDAMTNQFFVRITADLSPQHTTMYYLLK